MTAFKRIERRETVTAESVWREDDTTPTATTRASCITRYRVSGVEAVTLYASGGGRMYVPTTVVVEQAHADRPHVTVRGSLLRKDGTLGANLQDIHRYGWRRDEWPEWLRDIVKDAAS